MTQPTNNANIVVPSVAPVIRVPADDSSIQATNEALANLLALLGNPTQEGTLASVLTQLAQFGAQPWVPNVQSAAANEVGPGVTILGTPARAFRVWGGYVTASLRTNNTYSGTDGFFARAYVSSFPQLSVAHVELSSSGPNQAMAPVNAMQIPGVPFPAGTQLKVDLNGGVGLGTTGVLRCSANIFYSIP